MCVIIDTNLVSCILSGACPDAYALIKRGLVEGRPYRVRIVFGGRLRREYSKSRKLLLSILELERAGRARLIPDNACDAREAQLKRRGACCSDDEHVIALAQLSGARVLCSDDLALHIDFKDSRLLADPRGSIYRSAQHAPLIKKRCAQS